MLMGFTYFFKQTSFHGFPSSTPLVSVMQQNATSQNHYWSFRMIYLLPKLICNCSLVSLLWKVRMYNYLNPRSNISAYACSCRLAQFIITWASERCIQSVTTIRFVNLQKYLFTVYSYVRYTC